MTQNSQQANSGTSTPKNNINPHIPMQEPTMGQKLNAARDPAYFHKQHMKQKPKRLLFRLWDKTNGLLGVRGDKMISSRFIKMLFFPAAVLAMGVYSIWYPEILPWNSNEYLYKKFIERHGTGEDYFKNQQFMEKAQKNAIFLELRHKEYIAISQWHADHPNEEITAKIRRRIRNAAIKGLMEKYKVADLAEPSKAATTATDAL